MPSKRTDSPNTARLTPTDMMQQYRRIKAQYQDAILLFRFGDFYEMFCEDAERVARELQLVLTSRPQGKGMERVPMCGIPFYRIDGYIARLIGRGHKVAICEQLEEASPSKRLVERGVVRVVTPGTLYEVGEGETFVVALLPTEQRVACGMARAVDRRVFRHGFLASRAAITLRQVSASRAAAACRSGALDR